MRISDWSSDVCSSDLCAVTGEREKLCYVSAKSGAVVSAEAAKGYERQLLRLPSFLIEGGAAQWADIMDGLTLTGHFLERSVLPDRRSEGFESRGRLRERLKRTLDRNRGLWGKEE